MKSTLRLFLVRHGQVAANRDLRYIGRRDQPLTELGVDQARSLGTALADLPLERVLSSPLERARATAEAIVEARRGARRLELEVEDRLKEQDYGAWEGLSREEIRRRGSEDAECLRRFDADVTTAPPGGESVLSVQRRVVELAEELAAAGPARVGLVSHVGPIKALLAAALDISVQASRRLFLDPATITVVDWGPPGLLRLFNAHGHLGWTNALWMQSIEPVQARSAGAR